MNTGTRHAGLVVACLVLIAAFGTLRVGAGKAQIPRQKVAVKPDQAQIAREKVAVQSDKVSVHGHVKAPDGRGVAGVRLTLYSSAGKVAIDMGDSTNSFGFYSFAVARTLIGRTFQLTPFHPGAPGAPFSPTRRIFGLTDKAGPLDFVYQGPLPDLTCSQANIFFEMEGESRHYYIQVTVLNGLINGQGLASGPFKVRATYEDRTVNPWQMREAVFSVSNLQKGLTHVEGHISIGLYPPQAFFRLVKVEVDIENAVVESGEGNNVTTFS